jgi:hypothetical protein
MTTQASLPLCPIAAAWLGERPGRRLSELANDVGLV